MLAWMTYVVVVTLLLSAAALVAEHAVRQRSKPGRWIWALAIVASLALPTVISSVTIQLPALFPPAISQSPIVLRDATALHLPAMLAMPQSIESSVDPRTSDLMLKRIWIAASAGILAALIISGALVMRRKREWLTASMGGASVYVAQDVGPAVVGLLRPRIVVPAWLTQAPVGQQHLVIAHEQSHLDALDPQLLSVALCLLVAMPWNLPLWWQLSRLRRAIEVDCDARVVRGCRNVAEYGETLLAVGQRQSGFVGVAAAMSESTSFLEQRIKIMLKKPARWGRLVAAILTCLSMAAVTVAAAVSPPNADGSASDQPAHVILDEKIIDGYTGNYQIDEKQVMTVTRDGQRLYVQVTGQVPTEVFAKSETEFFAKGEKTQGTVVRDEHGRATAVVLHQKGQDDVTARRIDDAQAKRINDTVAARIRDQTASPGTEAALRRLIDQLRADPPNLSGIGPGLAKAITEQHPKLHPRLVKLGAVKSMEFVGVSDSGIDKYLVRYENGSAQWLIALNSSGVITGAFVSP